MKVILKRNWFAPGGRRFRKGISSSTAVEIPDSFKECLPVDAKVVGEDYAEPQVAREPDTLSEAAALYGADPDRAAGEAAEKVKEMAEQELSAQALQAELDAEAADEPKVSGKRGPGRPPKTPKEN